MYKLIAVDARVMRELVLIALPMVVSQGAFAAMIFTDRLFMSMISPGHMSAALGGGVASFFCLSLFIGLLSYANAIVAQYYGAGRLDKCSRALTQSYLLWALCVPVLLLLGYWVSDLFAAMGHLPEQVLLEREYFQLLIFAGVFALAKVCIASYFSGIGRTQVVMVADVLSVLMNIPLSYGLIFGVPALGVESMGIAGAAWGTIISSLLALAVFWLVYLQRQHRLQFKLAQSLVVDREILKRYLRLGLPSGVELFLNVAAFNLFVLMFQSYGVAEGAAVAIVFNWDMLAYVPMIGLNIGLISLVGRYVGAGDTQRIQQVVRAGFCLALLYAGSLAIVFVISGPALVSVFIDSQLDSQSHALATYMMWGLASYVVADAVILVAGGVLRGAGDTRWLMIASVSLHWLMLLGQYLVIEVYELGPRQSWLVFVAMIIAIAVVYGCRLRGDRWRRADALEAVMAGG